MGVFRKRHFIIVIVAACILPPAGTLCASRPAGQPQANLVTPRSAGPGADDLGLILQRLQVQFANPNNSHAAREPDYSRAEGYLSSLAADGRWPDIEYEGARPGWNAHLGRLVQMASSYTNAASPDYHSVKMLEGVERGLQYWVRNRQPAPHQWWQNAIGQPLELSRILVPLEDVLPADLLRQGLSYYAFPSEIDPRYNTGQNLVWFAQQQVISGALARSPEDIAAGSAALQREISITTGEGIQPDFSFHQHGPQLYNGGYGHDFMVDTSKYAAVLAGTRYAFTHEKLSLLADLLLMGSGHMIRGKWLDYSAEGRTLLRRGASEAAAEFAAACDELAALLPERAAELIALKKHIEGTGAAYSFLGNRYFWNSDFMTHQREAFYISVKMVSNRTVGTETLGGENLKGSWLPFGATWIVRRGDEYKDIFPVLDWGRLPGVTSAHMAMPTLNPPDWGRGVTALHKPTAAAPGFAEPESFVTFKGFSQPESFVGGVSDGTYGAAAMVFDKMETQGRKGWFFFDREMVAVGAAISSSRDEPVATTLNQTLLHGPVLIDGKAFDPGEAKVPQASWVLHDGVGYAFLEPAAVNIKVGPQTGDWKSVSAGYSDAPVTEQVFALWLDHGVRPSGAQYAYAVLPGTRAQPLAEWAAHPPVRIITNTTAQQAVIHDQLGVAEIVFYTPGSVALGAGWAVKVDEPCLALLAKHGNSTRIAVSSPGGEVPTVHLTLTTPQGEQSLTFELPARELAGKSQTMEVPIRW
jgi:chondroitin AC lyase